MLMPQRYGALNVTVRSGPLLIPSALTVTLFVPFGMISQRVEAELCVMAESTLAPAFVAVNAPQSMTSVCPAETTPVYLTQVAPHVIVGFVMLSPAAQAIVTTARSA